jgi:hypothetical protein
MLEFVYKKCSKRRPSTCVPSVARTNAATEMGEFPIELVAYVTVCVCVCVFVCICVCLERNIFRECWLSIFQNVVSPPSVSRFVHPASSPLKLTGKRKFQVSASHSFVAF